MFLLAVLMLLPTMASAQITQQVAVSVPFSFVADGHQMPAGDYTIELNLEKRVITLRSSGDFKKQALIFTANSGREIYSNKSYVTFRQFGSRHFLAEVRREGASQVLPLGQMEREIAKASAAKETATVEAKLLRR